MKIDKQILEDHQAKLSVEIDADEMEGYKHRAARKLSNRVRIPGFRPGKAPYPVILRQLGEPAILEEAIELIVDNEYPSFLEKAEVKPYGPGMLENIASYDPVVLEILVPLEAEVTLGDYRSLRKNFELPVIKKQDVDNVLKDLQDRQAVSEPVERPAQEGDQVTVRLSAIRKKTEEGQEPTLIRERSVPLIIKPKPEEAEAEMEGGADEWPYPGFSRNLIGSSPLDEKTFDYTYPDDSSYESLRGVEAEFNFTVENVKERILPELDDEFARSIGEYPDLEALTKEIETTLQKQAEETYTEEYDEALLEEATSQSTVKYPQQMLEREIDEVIHNLEDRLQQQGLNMDLYLKSRQLEKDGLREEAKPVAESRLKKSLVLMQIARDEDIQVEDEELRSETRNTMNTLATMMPKKDVRKLSGENIYRNVMTNIMADLISRRAMERLRDIGSGKLDSEKVERVEAEHYDNEKEISTPEIEEPVSKDVSSESAESVNMNYQED